MGDQQSSSTARIPPAAWWREREVLLLLMIVFAGFFLRLTALSIRGEEPRRAMVAAEILQSGDWIVPRQQGHLYFSRPPMGSWSIAFVSVLRGKMDLISVRLPTVTSILLMTLLIYGYGRIFLSRFGAFSAAAAFATMGQVLQIGRLAETEGQFTLLLGGALLLWHWGYLKKWPPLWMWMTSTTLCAFATLTKTPQGPVYFFGTVWCFLLWQRDRETLLSRSHMAGLLVYFTILAAWQIPYYFMTDSEAVIRIWFQNAVEKRYSGNDGIEFVKHLIVFPWQVLAAMLPWSIALAQLCFPSRWKHTRAEMTFPLIAIAVTLPTLWLVPGANTRYFMPIFPMVALLIGIVLEHCRNAAQGTALQIGWQRFALMFAAAAPIIGFMVLIVSLLPYELLSRFQDSLRFAIPFCLVSFGIAYCIWKTYRSSSLPGGQTCLTAMAGLIVTTAIGPLTNSQLRIMEQTAAKVAAVKQNLPNDANLVSLDTVHHTFRFHFETPITKHQWPEKEGDVPAEVEYFCFNQHRDKPRTLPFDWQPIATVSMERNRKADPENFVVIGKRIATRVAIQVTEEQ